MTYADEVKQQIPEGILQFCALAVYDLNHKLRAWFLLSPQENIFDLLGVGSELDEDRFRFLGVFNGINPSLRESVVCLVFQDQGTHSAQFTRPSDPAGFHLEKGDLENIDPRLPFVTKGPALPKPEMEYWRHCRRYIGHDMIFAPAAGALVMDDQGRMLLQRRGDDGTWGILGGGSEVGESPMDTAIREVYEETGLHVRVEQLLSVATGDDCSGQYPNGDKGKFWGFLFSARIVSGTMIRENEETLELRWFTLPEVEKLDNCGVYLKHNYTNASNSKTVIHAKRLV